MNQNVLINFTGTLFPVAPMLLSFDPEKSLEELMEADGLKLEIQDEGPRSHEILVNLQEWKRLIEEQGSE